MNRATRDVLVRGSTIHRLPFLILAAFGPAAAQAQCGLSFDPAVSYAVGTQPPGLTAGDFNGDGWTDLAATDTAGDTVWALLGGPGGIFQSASSYPVGPQGGVITAGDFNGDGRSDLVMARINPDMASVLIASAGGTFPSVTSFGVGSSSQGVAAGDLNNDGKLDFAIAISSGQVTVYLGNGNGAFQAPTSYSTGSYTREIALGDFNGDGRLDIAATNHSAGSVSILLGNGNGTFQPRTDYPTGDSNPIGIAAADFSGDGRIDLAVVNYASNSTVAILRGNGNGTFQSPVLYASGLQNHTVAAADFDGDGVLDLVIDNASGVAVFLGNPGGTFQPRVTFAAGGNPQYVAVGDFDGDGWPDVAVSNGATHDVSVLLNTSSCNHAPAADAGGDQSVPEGTPVMLSGSASGDPDGDAIVSYSWSQVGVEYPVSLNTSDPVHPTFTAPNVARGGATLTFQLVVSDGEVQSAPALVNITVTNVNHTPLANAGEDQAVSEFTQVSLDGSPSFDGDDDALDYAWSQTSGPGVTLDTSDPARPTFTAPSVGFSGATLTFKLIVSDGLLDAEDLVTVNVENVNHTPIADAGPATAVDEGAPVMLDGSASTDPDGDPLWYLWEQVGGPAVALSDPCSATPTFVAPNVGPAGAALVFRLTVSDGPAESVAGVEITVRNAGSPPACAAARPSEAVLWPPNHKLVPIAVLGVGGELDGVTLTITGVTQDEPVNGLGDGDTGADAFIRGGTVLLRAERSGKGNGRVYTIRFRAESEGGSCTGSVTVSVPRDNRPGAPAIDDGQGYNSFGG